MRKEIRDDIIALEKYCIAKFKLEPYIQILFDAGGYCFINQFYHHFGDNEGKRIVSVLRHHRFLDEAEYSNYNICYLTDSAIKYMVHKDSEKNFDDVDKSDISVKKISSAPTNKVLFSSSIKFALLQEYPLYGKEQYIRYLRKYIERKINNGRSIDDDLHEYDERCNDMAYNISKKKPVVNYIDTSIIGPLEKIYSANITAIRHIQETLKLIDKNIEEQSNKLGGHLFMQNTSKKTHLHEMKDKLTTFLEHILNSESSYILEINNSMRNYKKEFYELEISMDDHHDKFKELSQRIKNQEEKLEQIIKRACIYYDISKIIMYPKENELEVVIIDTGTHQKSDDYLKKINNFRKEANIESHPVKIVIASYSKGSANILKSIINELIEKRKLLEQDIDMLMYHNPTYTLERQRRDNPCFIKTEKELEKYPKITIECLGETQYIEKYRQKTKKKPQSISDRDYKKIDVFEAELKMD